MTEKRLWVYTTGENMWLRRRSRDQIAEVFAAGLGVSRTTLWRIEHDKIEYRNGLPIATRRPNQADLCALARRRSGLGRDVVAAAVGVSHVTLLAWERAGEAELVNFWRKKGYKFPFTNV